MHIQSCTWTSPKSMKGEAEECRCTCKDYMSCKEGGQSLRAVNKQAQLSKALQVSGLVLTPAEQAEWITRKPLPGQSWKHLTQLPPLGLAWRSHPPRSQIRQADKVLNESPHCCFLQTSSTLLRLCTHSLPSKQSPNFTQFHVSEDRVWKYFSGQHPKWTSKWKQEFNILHKNC